MRLSTAALSSDQDRRGVWLSPCLDDGRQVDRVGHDEQVRGPTPPLCDVLTLALGERDERVEPLDPAEDLHVAAVRGEFHRRGGRRWLLCMT